MQDVHMPVNALMHMAVAVGVDAAVDRIRKKLLSIGAWGSLHALILSHAFIQSIHRLSHI
jgi:hypothetical protein